MKKIITACLLCLSLTLVACGEQNTLTIQDTTQENYTYTKNPKWETFIVSIQSDYPPFAFKDEYGMLIGFEKDLLEAIATAGEFNIDVVDARRSDMLIQLNMGTADIWSSAITITPERQADMELSHPYLKFSQSVMILDTPQNAHMRTASDLQNKTLAYSSIGSTEKGKVVAINKNETLAIAKTSVFLAVRDVYTGKAVGAVGNSPVLSYYAMQYPNIATRLIPVAGDNTEVVFAMKKGNTQLRDKLNAGLAKVKADGTYDKLIQKWFGQI